MILEELFDALDVDLLQAKARLKLEWRQASGRLKRCIAGLIITVVHAALLLGAPGRTLEHSLLKGWFALRGERSVPKTVTIVRLDTPSYALVGRSPGEMFPREQIARAIEIIGGAGAKLIVADIFFTADLGSPEADNRLAEALASTPTFIGRRWEEISSVSPDGVRTTETVHAGPREIFSKNAKGVVALMSWQTEFGLVERICLPIDQLKCNVPLFSALQSYVSPDIERPAPSAFINFYGGPSSLTSLSFADLVAGADPTYFKDRVVLIGVMANSGVGLEGKDSFHTSFSNRPTYGIEIQGTIVANLLDRSWVRELNRTAKTLLIVALPFFLGILAVSLPIFGSLAILLLVGAVWFSISYLAFVHLYFFIPGATLFAVVLPAFLIVRLCAAFWMDVRQKHLSRGATDIRVGY